MVISLVQNVTVPKLQVETTLRAVIEESLIQYARLADIRMIYSALDRTDDIGSNILGLDFRIFIAGNFELISDITGLPGVYHSYMDAADAKTARVLLGLLGTPAVAPTTTGTSPPPTCSLIGPTRRTA